MQNKTHYPFLKLSAYNLSKIPKKIKEKTLTRTELKNYKYIKFIEHTYSHTNQSCPRNYRVHDKKIINFYNVIIYCQLK